MQYELTRSKVMTAEQVVRFLQDLADAVVDAIDDPALVERLLAKFQEIHSRHQPNKVMAEVLDELEPIDRAPHQFVVPKRDPLINVPRRKPQDLGLRP